MPESNFSKLTPNLNVAEYTTEQLEEKLNEHVITWLPVYEKLECICKQRQETEQAKNLVPIAMAFEFAKEYQELENARNKFLELERELKQRGIKNDKH